MYLLDVAFPGPHLLEVKVHEVIGGSLESACSMSTSDDFNEGGAEDTLQLCGPACLSLSTSL